MGRGYNYSDVDYDINKALHLIEALDNHIIMTQRPLPVISAIIHTSKHAINGGTMDTFKPLLRTSNYAGIDRRKKNS